MSPVMRQRMSLAVGMLCMLALAVAATWALANWTVGPQMYNGVALPPQDQLPSPRRTINDLFAGDLPAAWAIRDDTAITGTYGKISYGRGAAAVFVDVPSDWGTINVSVGESLELVIGNGQVKNVTAFISPVKEPTPRAIPLPVTSVTQQDDLTIVRIDPMPQLSNQVIMLVVEFDTKRGDDYAEYRWRVNP